MTSLKSLPRATIDEALPIRELRVERDVLIRAIAKGIKRWRVRDQRVKAHVNKLRRLVAVADKLNAAVNAADATLLKLGLVREIGKARVKRAAMTRVAPSEVPLGGHSAAIDLFLVSGKARERLQAWNRVHRPKPQRPQKFEAELTAELRGLCRKAAGCSIKEFEDFLASLTTSDEWHKAGLPPLSSAVLKKRAERASKKRATN